MAKVSGVARYEAEHLIYPLSSLVSFVVNIFGKFCRKYLMDFMETFQFAHFKVAELGGTLGLFLGFSFLGFFDALVNISCNSINVFMKVWK